MAFVALKPCCFAGQRFKIGETVPDELVHPGAANNLVKMQVIAEQGETNPQQTPARASTIAISIRMKDGDMPLELTIEGLQSVFDVLAGETAGAEEIIEKMTDGDALILLHASDKRKAVKAAAEARAAAINADQEGAESEGEQ